MGVEERFEGLLRSAACAPLSRESVAELLGLTANLIEERKRIRRLLRQLPENFAEVRKVLNELARTVR
jgi:Tfp pilus assembly protein PilO